MCPAVRRQVLPGAALRALRSVFTPGGGASRSATMAVPTDRRPQTSGLLWAAFLACDNPGVFSLPGGSQKAVGVVFLNPSAWCVEPDVLHMLGARAKGAALVCFLKVDWGHGFFKTREITRAPVVTKMKLYPRLYEDNARRKIRQF